MKEKRKRFRVRIDTLKPPFSLALPKPFGVLWEHYKKESRACLRLRVERLPQSLNSMYVKRSRSVFDLHPDVKALRDEVRAALGYKAAEWKPTGAVAALVFFYSPRWVTKDSVIHTEDADNKIKTLLDAVEKATEQPDEATWHIHCAKVLSNYEETVLYLFDLGDVVEYRER